MRRLRKFLTLSGPERRLVVKATVLLTLVRLGLGRLPFTTLHRLLAGRHGGRRGVTTGDRALTDLVVWAVDAASRHVPGRTTCLTRALTVQAMLAWGRYPSRLHVGVVRGRQGQLEAHAWVECDGRILVGGSASEIGEFTPLAAFDVSTTGPASPPPAFLTLPGDR
jgi:hypothetical protein